MIDDEESDTRSCRECHTELRLGDNAIAIREGVVGPRGFVPLEGEQLFCNEDCAVKHLDANQPVRLQRRIP